MTLLAQLNSLCFLGSSRESREFAQVLAAHGLLCFDSTPTCIATLEKLASKYNQECYEYAFLTDVLSMLCRGMSFAGIVMVRTKNHRNELRRDPSFLFDM